MLTTYFLQKIRKYALPLLALQSLVIAGLAVYFNFQSIECQKQKEDFTSLITRYQTRLNVCIDSDTESIIQRMSV